MLYRSAVFIIPGSHRATVEQAGMADLPRQGIVPAQLDIAQMAVLSRVFGHAVAQRGCAFDLVEELESVVFRIRDRR